MCSAEWVQVWIGARVVAKGTREMGIHSLLSTYCVQPLRTSHPSTAPPRVGLQRQTGCSGNSAGMSFPVHVLSGRQHEASVQLKVDQLPQRSLAMRGTDLT